MSWPWIGAAIIGAAMFGGSLGAIAMAVVAGGSRRAGELDHTFLSRSAGQ